MKLSLKQTIALDYLEDTSITEVLFGGGAGGGKSVIGCYWILKSALKYNGTRWLIGRAKLKTLKETTLNTFWEVCKMQGITSKTYNYNQTSGIITLANGSEIYLKDLFFYPSDPNFDELGSLEITGAFIDEANQVTEKAKEVVKTRIRYKLDAHGLVPKILMTCNPSKNWTYKTFYKPNRDGNLQAGRVFIQSLVTDNPEISRHYVDNLQSINDKSIRERLLHGNWDYDLNPARLVEYDPCTDVFTNSHVERGTKYITADIARFGQDKTVIIVWDGLRAIDIQTINSSTLTEAAERIKGLATNYSIPMSQVLCDEDGIGGGVVDILKCKGFTANKTSQKYANMKAECYYLLAEKVNKAELYIGANLTGEQVECIIQELQAIERGNIDKDTKPSINSKDSQKQILGRSPDYADALMMRMWFNVGIAQIYGVF
jgi:hypothetical protein